MFTFFFIQIESQTAITNDNFIELLSQLFFFYQDRRLRLNIIRFKVIIPSYRQMSPLKLDKSVSGVMNGGNIVVSVPCIRLHSSPGHTSISCLSLNRTTWPTSMGIFTPRFTVYRLVSTVPFFCTTQKSNVDRARMSRVNNNNTKGVPPRFTRSDISRHNRHKRMAFVFFFKCSPR